MTPAAWIGAVIPQPDPEFGFLEPGELAGQLLLWPAIERCECGGYGLTAPGHRVSWEDRSC